MKFNRILTLLTAITIGLCTLSSCGSSSSSNSTEGTQSTTQDTTTTQASTTVGTSEVVTTTTTEDTPQETLTDFDTYTSNTVVATGNNKSVKKAENVTYRAYFPLEQYGEFEYKFYFSNTVDSTWDKGQFGYAGMSGDDYTIVSASVSQGDVVSNDFDTVLSGELTNTVPVTFDGGNTSKDVLSGETFWSDAITLNIEEGHYLVWEWTVSGTNIPCTCMSNLTPSCLSKDGGETFNYTNEIPLPQLIGCNKSVKTKIVALGDSITQGCQTSEYAYKYWASNVIDELGTTDYSLWNLGLGYARASDCALDGDWLERAKHSDVVFVAFGTNDIVSGQYGVFTSSKPEDVANWIDTIVSTLTEAGCRVILFNAPPFNLDEDVNSLRVQLNELLPEVASKNGAEYFDFSTCLENPDDTTQSLYGQHPNDEGCKVTSDKLLLEYKDYITK